MTIGSRLARRGGSIAGTERLSWGGGWWNAEHQFAGVQEPDPQRSYFAKIGEFPVNLWRLGADGAQEYRIFAEFWKIGVRASRSSPPRSVLHISSATCTADMVLHQAAGSFPRRRRARRAVIAPLLSRAPIFFAPRIVARKHAESRAFFASQSGSVCVYCDARAKRREKVVAISTRIGRLRSVSGKWTHYFRITKAILGFSPNSITVVRFGTGRESRVTPRKQSRAKAPDRWPKWLGMNT